MRHVVAAAEKWGIIPALAGNRIPLRDEAAAAIIVAGKIDYLVDPGAARDIPHAAPVGRSP